MNEAERIGCDKGIMDKTTTSEQTGTRARESLGQADDRPVVLVVDDIADNLLALDMVR